MYNSKIKKRFIAEFSTSTSRRHAATVMFNTIEPYETEWGADFCTRSKEELEPVVSEIVGFRTNSKKLRLGILKAYIRWCKENKIDGVCEDLFLIDEIGLDKFKRQMVANPKHLQRYLDCICDKESEETVGCIYRCYYWLAYSGMKEEDALKVVASDVDLENTVVRYNGREYFIYREAVPAFRNCINLTQFRYKHANYKNNVYKQRAPGDILLRGISEKSSVEIMRVEMSKRAKVCKFKNEADKDDKSLDLKLSFYRVQLSGLFYRTYEAERAGMPVDFSAAVEQFMEGKTYKLDSGRNLIGAKKRQLANEYMEDYNRWKEAYSI